MVSRLPGIRMRVGRAFTLVELMVVIAIISILAGAATVYVNPGRYSNNVTSFAESVAAEIDAARWRATSSNKWQMVSVFDDRIFVEQAPAEGMAGIPLDGAGDCADPLGSGGDPNVPDVRSGVCWQSIKTVRRPSSDIEIVSVDDTPHLIADDNVPAEGAGLDASILIGPDGSVRSNGWTIFIADSERKRFIRVLVYRATGTVSILKGW